ncbi:MAG: 2-oxoglutarate ferredoxin oxidoreductase subunit beta [Planctomycetota bacterium]|jgi:2-oxoglutarate ferredoxin oxidoreductase subunit beta
MTITETKTLTKKDLKSDQDVRWCPGCGDYAILNAVQAAQAKMGIPKEQFMWVSGIGCSSRFPFYMDCYGFHTIHGRAPAFATGIKVANPELAVWLATGDGDCFSIGGNHIIHLLRRNVDIKVLVFNNEIYGLTKGQYSPTSPIGLKAKSTPMGSVDRPFSPLSLALGAGATFVARTPDNDMKHMAVTINQAAAHKGTAFVEIYQNCVIFNDGAFNDFLDKGVRKEKTIDLQPGEPMVYGEDSDKGLRLVGFQVERCSAADADIWDPTDASPARAFLMAQLDQDPNMPNPIGLLRQIDAPIFDAEVNKQVTVATEAKGPGKLKDLIYAGDLWDVE